MKENMVEIIVLHDDEIQTGSKKGISAKYYEDFFASFTKEKHTEIKSTLITFGSEYVTAFENTHIKSIKIKHLGSEPNGSHPVFDSAAKAIDDTGLRYSQTAEEEHPSKVIFIITCFGKDNASKSSTIYDIRDKIIHQSDVYKWKFFLITDNPDYANELPYASSIVCNNYEEYGENNYGDTLSELSVKLHEYLYLNENEAENE